MKKYIYEIQNGEKVRREKDLKRLLNLNMLDVTNKSVCCGELDLPQIFCDIKEYPDYIALYSQPGDYYRTPKTCVSFYDFDNKMDGQNGLRSAIYYGCGKQLNFYKERFSGVPYVIMPDYSIMGDVPAYINYYRMGAAREAAIWLTLECGCNVIPNLAAGSTRDFKYMFDGYDYVRTACISTKGKLQNPADRELLAATIDESVARMPFLKAFIVFDVTADNREAKKLFADAQQKGIEIVIPDNMLKMRNRILQVRKEAI